MVQITLALDWTPNTNHIGFFIAQAKGFYAEAGLDVLIQDPSTDDYAESPAKKVELGKVDFALCPMESIIAYRTKANPFPLLAVAALLQDDLSAIACRKDAGITKPSELDGKRYASYKARYEDGIVKQMVCNDGGKGDVQLVYPPRLGIWNTILTNEFDATWVFLNWEALQKSVVSENLNYFKMADYKIPYSYSPVIATNEALIGTKQNEYAAFLAATKKGFLYAQDNQDESAEILGKFVPAKDHDIDLKQSLAFTAPHFGSTKEWGILAEDKIDLFLEWLRANDLEKAELQAAKLISNKLLEQP